MTLFHSFSLFSLQVTDKFNLAFWSFAYFHNWLFWCDFQLKISNLFSTLENGSYRKEMFLLLVDTIKNYILILFLLLN